DASGLKSPDPLAPVMPVNSAKLVSRLTIQDPGEKVGAVLRPCELRAVVELVKLNQASLEKLVLIGIDCWGTYSISKFSGFLERIGDGKCPGDEFLARMREGGNDQDLRAVCQICGGMNPESADVSLLLFGTDSEKEIILRVEDALADEVSQKLKLEETNEPSGRNEALLKVSAEREEKRNVIFKEIKEKTGDVLSLISLFSACIKCQNCQRACPICYCSECIFDTDTMRYEPQKYMRWSCKKGTLRMPADTLLFHMTRMNHMIASCIACGLCEDACPNDIPVGRIFRCLGEKVQQVFEYTPGRSVDEELPLATFREDELEPR
ncbi:MAG: 4Fe-4S dicluster domain-containing protein, partial [bacterium]